MSIRGEQENSLGLFRIGQVSRLTDTKPFVLRYWETEFPMLQPVKSPKGHRLYRQEDVDTVLRIKRLLYDEGFTIAGARRHLREGNGASPAPPYTPLMDGAPSEDGAALANDVASANDAASANNARHYEDPSGTERVPAERHGESLRPAHFDAGTAVSRKVLLDLRDSLRAFLTLLESE